MEHGRHHTAETMADNNEIIDVERLQNLVNIGSHPFERIIGGAAGPIRITVAPQIDSQRRIAGGVQSRILNVPGQVVAAGAVQQYDGMRATAVPVDKNSHAGTGRNQAFSIVRCIIGNRFLSSVGTHRLEIGLRQFVERHRRARHRATEFLNSINDLQHAMMMHQRHQESTSGRQSCPDPPQILIGIRQVQYSRRTCPDDGAHHQAQHPENNSENQRPAERGAQQGISGKIGGSFSQGEGG